MKKYQIPVSVVFSGYVEVKANDEEEATETALKYFTATIGECSDSGCDKIIDWNIDLHGNTEDN